MKKLSLLLIVILLTTVFVMTAHASLKKVGQTGLQYLKIGVGARSAAMGEAFTLVGNDANAIFYNPAGIAKMNSNFDVLVSRTNWVADISYNAVGIVGNFGNWGNFGLSLIYSDYGDDIIGTRVASNDEGFIETGKLDVGAYAVGLSYARDLTDKFTVGGQIKYTAQHLGSSLLKEGENVVENKVSGLAFDFGTIFYPGFKSLRFGVSIRNFSPQFKYQETPFQLPLTISIGFTFDMLDLLGDYPGNSFVLGLDAIHPRDYTERIHLGGEYWYKDMVALRAGYKFNYDEESFSFGLGVKINVGGLDLKLDYAYSDFASFSAVNRITMGFSY